jgi:hypothetical protein
VTNQSSRIAALLHEAGETHHLVYRIVHGDDPDWASGVEHCEYVVRLTRILESASRELLRALQGART